MKSAPASNAAAAAATVSGSLPESGDRCRADGADVRELNLPGRTDAALALAAAVRDQAGREAFVEIVRRHQNAVCAVAWSVTGRVGLTDDIAQETFLQAWKQIPALRDPAKLKAWLTRIAHGCAVNALRREKPHTSLSLDDPAFANLQGASGPLMAASASASSASASAAGAAAAGMFSCGSAAPDKAAADAEDEALVWSALAALPENLRTPLVLFYREGQSMAAVAAALDLSEEAVRQRLSRGRQALRSAVESRIETVLGRVQPSALLIVTIASGIGLLTKPAALAAGIASGTVTGAAATAAAAAAAAAAGGTGAAATAAAGNPAAAAAASLTTAGSGSAAGAAAAGLTTFPAFMTMTSWLAAALSLAVFFPAGWKAHGPSAAAGDGQAPPALLSAGNRDDPPAVDPGSRLLAVWRRLHAEHGADAAAMPVIFDRIQAEPGAFRRRALTIALMSEWAEVDPEGGFEKLGSGSKNTEQAALLIREWLKRDPEKAAAHLLAGLPGAEALAAAAAMDVAELAPGHFTALLTALPLPVEGKPKGYSMAVFPESTALGEAFARFARSDLKAAADALPLLKGPLLREAQVAVASQMAAGDPAAALKWALAQPYDAAGGAGISALPAAVMAVWAGRDPAAALDAAGGDSQGKKLAGIVLETVAARDPRAAVALRLAHPERFGEDAWGVFYGPLTRRLEAEPLAALEFLKSQPAEIRKPLTAALQVGGLDPASLRTAWQWVLAEKPEGMAADLCGKLVEAAVETDPREGWKQLKNLPPEWQAAVCRDETGLAGKLSAGQMDELLDSLSGEARSSLLLAAFKHGQHGSPPDAALWRRRLDELPPESRAGAAGAFARSLVSADPQLAVSFAESAPEGPVRDQAYSELMDFWVYQDSLAASQWADRLPPGSGRDAAAAALAGRLNHRDPAALAWAGSIADGALRLRTLGTLLDAAAAEGPSPAAALLASPRLSGPDREALLLARPQLNPSK